MAGMDGRYADRMRRVLRHIDAHPEADLSVAVLADVAAFSAFHFHRLFSSLFGIGVHRYVQLVRLERASWRLAFRDRETVLRIALDCGYQGPEAFARAFRRDTGRSPRAYRREPAWESTAAALAPLADIRRRHMTRGFGMDEVEVVDFPETPVAVLTHRGDPAGVGETVRRFIAWRRENRLPPPASATFNIFHSDPAEGDPAAFRMDLCAATSRPIATNDAGVVAGTIPGGRCAVLRQVGGGDLEEAARFLYARWLPESGHELRDFPLFARRVSMHPEVPEHEAVTELHLPIR
jgi:AraC family transcriptional regulator